MKKSLAQTRLRKLALAFMLAAPPLTLASIAMLATPQMAMAYVASTIQPSHLSTSQLQIQVDAAYAAWKTRYLKTDPQDSQRMYVWFGSTSGKQVVSEGQGFGMVAVTQMAGRDANAQAIFDKLFRYYRAHPSNNSPALMAWAQKLSNGQLVDTEGSDSATDGDMDAAYALLMADKVWGSNGAINYRAEAINTINALMSKTVNQTQWTIKLGDWANDSDATYGKSTRGSDFMFTHLRAFHEATGDARWKLVLDKSYQIADSVYRAYSPSTGLLPDFIVPDGSGGFKPSPPNFLEADTDGKYSWNNCRVPWRFSLDYLLNGDTRALALLQTLNSWVRTSATGGDPNKIRSGYELNGTALNSDYSNAFSAPFAVSAAISASNQSWLNTLWDRVAANAENAYYADSIRLLSMIGAAGFWQQPGAASSTPAPTPVTPTLAPTATPTSTPASTPVASSTPTPVGACTEAAWTTKVYNGGDKVSYNGRIYQAQWWTQNDVPLTNSGSGKPWKDLGACSTSPTAIPTLTPAPTATQTATPTATPNPTSAPTSTPQVTVAPTQTPAATSAPTATPGSCAVAWTEGNTYQSGTIVSYSGVKYQAQVTHTAFIGAGWTPPSTPTLWKALGPC
ncbi:glycosyl hydrolase family 8 [Chitinibacter sp. GC72]|uniref:glycosyl hydrolase family 8 n=1 Tax=Chitinibacter sp. GC72 TaxID=1526917 RepID=UPI0012FB94C9|nr:glycosyl hydrolase family 8 [Chitinibacter sp. GC72]